MAKRKFNALKNDKRELEVKEETSTVLSFAVFGCLMHIMFAVITTGTQDILAGTHIPTTTVLCVSMIPQFLVESIAPYFLNKIPQFIRVSFIFVTSFVGYIIVAYVNSVYWKIAGVGIVTFGLGTGLISMASLLSFFKPAAMGAYSTGTGVGIFIGTLYYTAMTTWLCVSPNATFVVLSPFSVLYLITFYVISRNRADTNSRTTTRKEAEYTKIEDRDTDDEKDEDSITNSESSLSRKEKMLTITKLFSLTVIPTFMIFFSHYVSSQSVITTIAFKNSPFRPRDHYQYYVFTFMFGEMIGRCHRSLLSLVNIRWVYVPSRRLLWSLALFEFFSLLLFIFQSWYHFLPSVAIVIFFCLLTGISVGSLFDNMLVLLHITFEGKQREFIMGYAMFPISAGLLASAFVGLYLEPRLLEHCISITQESAYCYTRPNSLKDVTVGCRNP